MQNSLKQFDYEKLRECSQNGTLPVNRVKRILNYSIKDFKPEDFLFLEKHLALSNQNLAIKRQAVLLLCHFGNPINKYFNVLPLRIFSSNFSDQIVKIAEAQNDPETVLGIADKVPNKIGLVITILKRMGKQEYLTSFLFSGDESIVKLVKDIGEM